MIPTIGYDSTSHWCCRQTHQNCYVVFITLPRRRTTIKLNHVDKATYDEYRTKPTIPPPRLPWAKKLTTLKMNFPPGRRTTSRPANGLQAFKDKPVGSFQGTLPYHH
jgi:hypothetical protein